MMTLCVSSNEMDLLAEQCPSLIYFINKVKEEFRASFAGYYAPLKPCNKISEYLAELAAEINNKRWYCETIEAIL